MTAGGRALFAAAARDADAARFVDLPSWQKCIKGAEVARVYRIARDARHAADKALAVSAEAERYVMAAEEKRTICAEAAAIDRDCLGAEIVASEAVRLLRERDMAAWRAWLAEQPPRDDDLAERIELGETPEAFEAQCMYLEERRQIRVAAEKLRIERRREGEVVELMRFEERTQRRIDEIVAAEAKRIRDARNEVEKQAERLAVRARLAYARGGLAAQRWLRARVVWEEASAVAERRAMGTEDLEHRILRAHEAWLVAEDKAAEADAVSAAAFCFAAASEDVVKAARDLRQASTAVPPPLRALVEQCVADVKREAVELRHAVSDHAEAEIGRDKVKKKGGRKLKDAESVLREQDQKLATATRENDAAVRAEADARDAVLAAETAEAALVAAVPLRRAEADAAGREAKTSLRLWRLALMTARRRNADRAQRGPSGPLALPRPSRRRPTPQNVIERCPSRRRPI